MIGFLWLTAGKEKFTWKKLLNPSNLSLVIGMILGLTGLPLPGFLTQALSAAAGCFSPLAMILTGFVIGKFDLLMLLTSSGYRRKSL